MNNTSELTQNITPPDWHQPLWYRFEECAVAPYAFIFYFTVKVFNLALGFPTNIVVMWYILTGKSEGSTSDVFTLNLAAVDAFFCMMTPVELLNRLYLNHWGVWYLQRFAYGLKDTAPLFLSCICLDRYIAVVHPIMFMNIRDNRIRRGILALVWALVLPLALVKSILGEHTTTDIFSGLILCSFFIMVFCNISVIWALRRSVAGKESIHPVKKRAFKTVLILLAIIVFNYLPPVALMPFASKYTFVQMNCQISVSVFSIMDSSSTIEPIHYISKMDRPCSCLKGFAKKPVDVAT